jgi:outer membrane protein OmpA-like peptidoglycan-associated protein
MALAVVLVVLNVGLLGLNLAKRDVLPFSFGLSSNSSSTEDGSGSTSTVTSTGTSVVNSPSTAPSGVTADSTGTTAAPTPVDDWPGGHGPVPADPPQIRRAVITPDGRMRLTGSAPSWATVIKIVQYAGEKLPAGPSAIDNELTWHPDASPDTQWGQVVMDQAATFAVGQSTIDPASIPALDLAAQMLVAHPTVFAVVIGHADNVGDEATNAQLASDRARAIVDYLVGKGVVGGQLVIASAGEDNPVASNDTPEGRAINRRIEIQFKNVLIAEPTYGGSG